MTRKIKITIDGTAYLVEVKDINADPIEMTVDGEKVSVTFGAEDTATPIQRIETKDVEVDEVSKDDLKVSETPKTVSAVGPIKDFTAPMPGMIISIAVKVGDQVVPGDEICVLEAMKMQQTLRAEWTGIVDEIHVETGQQIQGGDKILGLA
ncbi:MAG: hypothetical protein CL707_09150 [Chloroflexi bacterium]|nr:hypothetical protein [Chloroflexota bacterium]|tara:strand:+ start:2166 stop:2618 length:453 start_codon:yes stop_codon:yes gene_type:complete